MNKFYKLPLSLICLLTIFMACSESNPSATQSVVQKTETKQKNKPPAEAVKSILFFGNSLTAAYGIDPEDGFVSLIQDKITDAGKTYRCINGGLSGETTAGGKNRIEWILKNTDISIFVLELGGNDGLRGIDPKSSMANLQAIIETVKKVNPEIKILLAGMEAPPNMGEDYTKTFRNIYPALAARYKVDLIPFLLDGVAGKTEFNLKDGIHPNEAGQKILAENIWKVLKNLI